MLSTPQNMGADCQGHLRWHHGVGGDSTASTVRTAVSGALEHRQPPAGPEQGRKCAWAQSRKGGKRHMEKTLMWEAPVAPGWIANVDRLQALNEE